MGLGNTIKLNVLKYLHDIKKLRINKYYNAQNIFTMKNTKVIATDKMSLSLCVNGRQRSATDISFALILHDTTTTRVYIYLKHFVANKSELTTRQRETKQKSIDHSDISH